MSQAQNAVLNQSILNAANRAVFEFQYNTVKAVKFIQSEVAGATVDMASKAIDTVARPAKKGKGK